MPVRPRRFRGARKHEHHVPTEAIFTGARVLPAEKGIAAIVPPQLAIPTHGVPVLDFGRDRYELLSTEDVAARSSAPTFEASNGTTCGTALRISVVVDGAPATLAIDTGSTHPAHRIDHDGGVGRPHLGMRATTIT